MQVNTHSPRICVLGCGPWGKNLVRNFHQLGHLHGVYDIQQEAATQQALQYPGVTAYSSLEQALGDPDVDAVVVATPAQTHMQIATAALEAGKDTLVEKPLAVTSHDGMRMVHKAHALGRILMVGHLLIYHPAVRKIAELVRSDALGELEYIYSNRLSMGRIRREENALWSFAPHDVAIILRLCGQMPIQAVTTGGAYLQPNVADVTVSNLLFPKGRRAHIFVSWLHPYKEQRLVVIGSRRVAVFEDSLPLNKLRLYDKQIELQDGALVAQKHAGTPVELPLIEPLAVECQHFIECVRERKSPDTPGEEGLRVLEVLEACQTSLQLNGQPVLFPKPSERDALGW